MWCDVIIVGAGPAGLSAALVLGRCCRRVVVFDDGRPRNAASAGVHNFLTRDGMPPSELLRIAREQLQPYDVTIQQRKVRDVRTVDGGFVAELGQGRVVKGRKVLLATGVRDCLPEVPGLTARWGRSVFQCPYCDAWEFRQQPIGAYAQGRSGIDFALALTTWSSDVTLFTDGRAMPEATRDPRFVGEGIQLVTDPIAALGGPYPQLRFVELTTGAVVPLRALFLHWTQVQRTHLASSLGCEIMPRGTVATGRHERTRVPGVYVAGDVAGDVQFAIVAAAEGAQAAYAINRELRLDDTGGHSPSASSRP